MELEQNLITRFEPPHRLMLRQAEHGIPSDCLEYAIQAVQVARLVGETYSKLCVATAPFQVLIKGFEKCVSKYENASEATQETKTSDLIKFIEYCATAGPEGTSSSEFAALSSLASVLGVTLTEVRVTDTVISFRTITQVPSTTSSASDGPTSHPPPNHTGLIAGVIVGCVVAIALLVAFLAFIIRRRKQARLPEPDVTAAEPKNLKPQLHSDDLKPDREELEGEGAGDNNRNRVAAELPAKIPAELPANEAVGPELESPASRTTRTGTNETESSATLY